MRDVSTDTAFGGRSVDRLVVILYAIIFCIKNPEVARAELREDAAAEGIKRRALSLAPSIAENSARVI